MARTPRERRHELYVFTEGKVTEPEYVDQLKRLQNRYVVKVSDQHGEPRKIVPLAIAHKRQMDQLSRDDGLPAGEQAVVWCLFDRDRHPGIDPLVADARHEDVRVAFSHPCFEFWILLHFEDCATPMAGQCMQACRRLRKHLPDAGKRFDLGDLGGRFKTARTRAERIARRHDDDGVDLPSKRDPSTEVWQFVDALEVDY